MTIPAAITQIIEWILYKAVPQRRVLGLTQVCRSYPYFKSILRCFSYVFKCMSIQKTFIPAAGTHGQYHRHVTTFQNIHSSQMYQSPILGTNCRTTWSFDCWRRRSASSEAGLPMKRAMATTVMDYSNPWSPKKFMRQRKSGHLHIIRWVAPLCPPRPRLRHLLLLQLCAPRAATLIPCMPRAQDTAASIVSSAVASRISSQTNQSTIPADEDPLF